MNDGRVVAPVMVRRELERWVDASFRIGAWLDANALLFRDLDHDKELAAAKRVVNAFPAYGSSQNYLGDLEVISLALAADLTVLSLETRAPQHSPKRPKIPNVCAHFGVPCVNLAGFLRAEGFTGEGQPRP
jgi:hypothetical protein